MADARLRFTVHIPSLRFLSSEEVQIYAATLDEVVDALNNHREAFREGDYALSAEVAEELGDFIDAVEEACVAVDRVRIGQRARPEVIHGH